MEYSEPPRKCPERGVNADMNKFWLAAPVVAFLTGLATLLPPAAGDDPPRPIKPVNLDCNTKADEDDPHVTSSGATLYYTSNAKKKIDLMASKRTGGKWTAGKSIVDVYGSYIATAADDRSVFVTSDSVFPQYLYYATNKNELDQKGDNFDLYVTSRLGPNKEFDPPVAVTKLDTPADELHPWLTKDGKTLYFSRKTKKDGYRVFAATRKSATGGQGFEDPVPVEDLPTDFHHATLTPDGKTMYLQGPLEKSRWGLFVSTNSEKTWSKPEPLDLVNDDTGPTGDRSPCLSRDGLTLYFASDREGGKGGLDLYSIPVADLKKK
jgi:WD40-like Beta Propeller Repeat